MVWVCNLISQFIRPIERTSRRLHLQSMTKLTRFSGLGFQSHCHIISSWSHVSLSHASCRHWPHHVCEAASSSQRSQTFGHAAHICMRMRTVGLHLPGLPCSVLVCCVASDLVVSDVHAHCGLVGHAAGLVVERDTVLALGGGVIEKDTHLSAEQASFAWSLSRPGTGLTISMVG